MRLLYTLALLLSGASALRIPPRAPTPKPAAVSARAADLSPRSGGYKPAKAARNLWGGDSSGECGAATFRDCWPSQFDGQSWDITTDFEHNVPHTGVTQTYTFEITEEDNWVGPDGMIKAKAMLINGAFPGPVIKANWGDMIKITVVNKLRTNGTSFHWHGIRMLNNNVNDGVGGVTECPIPPGESREYTWLAEQYGSSWYHSHFGSQYANGLVGAIQIDGPSSANYDVDLGVLPITDWYYRGADEVQFPFNHVLAAPPPSDNILIGGSHVNAQGGGSYFRTKLEKGKRHLLRIINMSVDNTFTVSLAGHSFTVVQTDFVPVQPVTMDSVYMVVGQRYEVIIEADQDVANYWFNVTMDPSGLCGITNSAKPASVFQYEGAPDDELPLQPGAEPAVPGCVDRLDFVPIVTRAAPRDKFSVTAHNGIDVVLAANTSTVQWNVHGQPVNVTWDEPTLEYVVKGRREFPSNYNVILNPDRNEWSYWLVQNVGLVPHPMHLHGHDFMVVGRSAPVADPLSVTADDFHATLAFRQDRDMALLNFDNPTRRDATMLPAWGWMVVAFKTDNPGAWLMHCHIAWHVSQGLGVQFLERVDDIPQALTLGSIQPTCGTWHDYWVGLGHEKYDSGL